MVVLKLSFGKTNGKNTVELKNETAATTNGPIDLGEANIGPNRILYLVSKQQGYFSSEGKVGILYKSPDLTHWIYHKFKNIGQDEDVTVKYETTDEYDGPFKEGGKLMIYLLTRPLTFFNMSPIPGISQENLYRVIVPENRQPDVIHTKNLDNASNLGCWVGGYFPNISTSNAPMCVATYQYRGISYGVTIELFGAAFSNDAYKLSWKNLTSAFEDLLGAEIHVSNVIQTPDYRCKVTAEVRYHPDGVGDSDINTKKQTISIPPVDTNFIFVHWNVNLAAGQVKYDPGGIFRPFANTRPDYAPVVSLVAANYPMFSYPEGTFSAGIV